MVVWLFLTFYWFIPTPEWGFFGHRMINRQAVYTIPAPLNQFYKRHAPYLEEHGVDPDKRRYAIPQEYKRHYIDLDILEERKGGELGTNLQAEIMDFLAVVAITPKGDSIRLVRSGPGTDLYQRDTNSCPFSSSEVLHHFQALQSEEPYDEVWMFIPPEPARMMDTCGQTLSYTRLIFLDEFSIHGILPYWLPMMQHRLTNAFLRRDIPLILRLSADIGHYIADAHVPLHTTANYNGQLTGQQGIHGFWESRIPELFSADWDLVTGPASYVSNYSAEAWRMVRESHAYVEDVLSLERSIREGLSSDRIMCFEDRNTYNVLTYCLQYAKEYQDAMDGMVEKRFREAIVAIGSAWYTAWVDAGQPDLWKDAIVPTTDDDESTSDPPATAQPLGRPHDN
ncbi:MAG: hypothetical protein K9I85_03420 [Saprospiraceae bacterium]|nr:hypothetical protein [Saprospiraceae bacterium]